MSAGSTESLTMAVHSGAKVVCSDASTGGSVAVWGSSPGSVVVVVGGMVVVVVVVVELVLVAGWRATGAVAGSAARKDGPGDHDDSG